MGNALYLIELNRDKPESRSIPEPALDKGSILFLNVEMKRNAHKLVTGLRCCVKSLIGKYHGASFQNILDQIHQNHLHSNQIVGKKNTFFIQSEVFRWFYLSFIRVQLKQNRQSSE